jgi:hypothetical protein
LVYNFDSKEQHGSDVFHIEHIDEIVTTNKAGHNIESRNSATVVQFIVSDSVLKHTVSYVKPGHLTNLSTTFTFQKYVTDFDVERLNSSVSYSGGLMLKFGHRGLIVFVVFHSCSKQTLGQYPK